MSATVAAALKKIAVAILTDKKALKTVGGIILGILIIICLPVVSIISILNGDIQFDEARLQQIVVQNLSAEEQIRLQAVEDTMYAIDTAMRDRGFDAQRVKEAQVLYVLALSDCSGRSGFVQKLVGCFAEGQSDSQLIAAVNVAFGKEIDADEFSKIMNTIRAVYISTSGYVDPYTKNNLDLVTWAKNAKEKGWGYSMPPWRIKKSRWVGWKQTRARMLRSCRCSPAVSHRVALCGLFQSEWTTSPHQGNRSCLPRRWAGFERENTA